MRKRADFHGQQDLRPTVVASCATAVECELQLWQLSLKAIHRCKVTFEATSRQVVAASGRVLNPVDNLVVFFDVPCIIKTYSNRKLPLLAGC